MKDPINELPPLSKVETAAVVILGCLVVYVLYQVYKTGQAISVEVADEFNRMKNAFGDAVTGAETYVKDAFSGAVEGVKQAGSNLATSTGHIVSDLGTAPQTAMTQPAGGASSDPSADSMSITVYGTQSELAP